MIIPFKGRCLYKQYIKGKPHKWSRKVFCQSGISGIVYDFEVYGGKGTVVKAKRWFSEDKKHIDVAVKEYN